MPAFILLARIGWFPVVFPWFVLWVVLIPLSCLAWAVSVVAGVFPDSRRLALLKSAPRLALAAANLHGARVSVRSDEASFSLAWI